MGELPVGNDSKLNAEIILRGGPLDGQTRWICAGEAEVLEALPSVTDNTPESWRGILDYCRIGEKQDGKTVFQYMGLELELILVMPTTWGPISEDARREWQDDKRLIFLCGICSTETARVFHNLFGGHYHIPGNELLAKMKAMELAADHYSGSMR